MIIRIFSTLTLFLLLGFAASAQSISGTIRDGKTNESVIGAVVTLKGSNTGTITDIDGKFELPVDQAPPFIIVVSFVGYVAQELTVKSIDQSFNIKLESKK